MKNLLKTMCLSSLLMLSLASCASEEGGATASNSAGSAAQNESSSAQSESSENTDTNAEEQDSNTESDVLRVGMDLKFPPFSSLADDGTAEGFEPELALAFGEFIGREVEIVDSDFSMLIPALEMGDVEILIADMAATEERALKADFSDPYRYTYTLALVNQEFATENNISDDMSEEDFFALDANFIGLSGTKGVYYPLNYGIMVTEVTEIGTGLTEVSMGMSDVLIASNEVHGFHAADPDNTMVYSGILAQDGSNFAVKKGNQELLDLANEFIASLYEEGGLYEEMSAEWDPIIADFLNNDDLGLDYIVQPSS